MLFAEENNYITALTQYGFGGAMAAVVAWFYWYTIKTTIPQMISAFREELKWERESHERQLEATIKSNREQVSEIIFKINSELVDVKSLLVKGKQDA